MVGVNSFLVDVIICGASSALKAQMAHQSGHIQFYFCFLHCISDFSHLYDTSNPWESHELLYVSNCVILQLLCHFPSIVGLTKSDYNGMCSDTIREIFGEVNDKDLYYVVKPLFMHKITFEKSSLLKFNTKQ